MDFDCLLARQFQRIALGLAVSGLGACAGGDEKDQPGVCEGGVRPAGHQISEGYVLVEVGEACPELPESLSHTNCCPSHVFAGEVCGFTRKLEKQVLLHPGTAPGKFEDWVGQDTGYSVEGPVDVCMYNGLFEVTGTCCGRPLVVDGDAVLPAVRHGPSRSAWDLVPEDRARIAGYWLAAARMEHASVASFARFTLDLVRLGAPSELLAAAQRAGLDEVDHAERCFELAGQAMGRQVRAGPLPVGALPASSVVAIVEALVREGCIGETLAALDAAARLVGATEPSVRDTLEVVKRDESAHAALAWRTLRWLLAEDDGVLVESADRVFAAELARLETAATSGGASAVQRAHGVLGEAEVARVHAEGWDCVILPAWNALSTGGTSRNRAAATGT